MSGEKIYIETIRKPGKIRGVDSLTITYIVRKRKMRWLILIGDNSFSLNTIKSVKHEGCIARYDVKQIEGRYCVDYGKDHIFYDYNRNIEEFEEDFTKVPYISPHFITMIYTSEERVKQVLRLESFPKNIYIDNDHGIVLPIGKFIQIGMPLQ